MDELMEFMIPNGMNFDLVDSREYTYWKLRKQRVFTIDWELGDDYEAIELAKIIMQMNFEEKDIPEDQLQKITLLIFSYGGSIDQAQALCDIIEASRIPIVTVCMGVAMSAGFLIFLAGKRRYAFKQGSFMIHQGEAVLSGSADMIQQAQDNYRKTLDQMKEYILERTTIDPKLFKKNKLKDWYLSSQEASELGVCKVVSSFDEII